MLDHVVDQSDTVALENIFDAIQELFAQKEKRLTFLRQELESKTDTLKENKKCLVPSKQSCHICMSEICTNGKKCAVTNIHFSEFQYQKKVHAILGEELKLCVDSCSCTNNSELDDMDKKSSNADFVQYDSKGNYALISQLSKSSKLDKIHCGTQSHLSPTLRYLVHESNNYADALREQSQFGALPTVISDSNNGEQTSGNLIEIEHNGSLKKKEKINQVVVNHATSVYFALTSNDMKPEMDEKVNNLCLDVNSHTGNIYLCTKCFALEKELKLKQEDNSKLLIKLLNLQSKIQVRRARERFVKKRVCADSALCSSVTARYPSRTRLSP